MFTINGNPILEDEIIVLQELRAQLQLQGIEKFKEFRVSGRNIQFNCPIHNNGQERKPSCGVSTTDTYRDNTKIPAGTVHCFSCGYTATLEEMISNCFGKDDLGVFGRQWLTKNFLTISVEQRKDINLNFERTKQKELNVDYIAEKELEQYRYYHDYMFERGLTEELIEMFDIGYDDKFILQNEKHKTPKLVKSITFPVRDITGGTLFIARRSVKDKLFHYPEGVDKPVYGLYELKMYAPKVTEVIVVESFFNALSCWKYGRPAVALMGLGTESQYEQLKKLNCRKLILAFDPDEAGHNAANKLTNNLRREKLISRFVLPPKKDINDLTEKEFKNLEEIF